MPDHIEQRAKAFFDRHHGQTIYPDDIAEALNITVGEALGVCKKLEATGQIRPVPEIAEAIERER